MNGAAPDLPPDPAQSALNVLEFLAKAAGAAVIVWGFIKTVGKPYFEWRQRRLNEAITIVLKKELHEHTMEMADRIDLALARQDRVFEEIDLLVVVMADDRDRHDEMTELLNTQGMASKNRRVHADRRQAADEAMAELQGRLRSRRRKTDEIDEERFL